MARIELDYRFCTEPWDNMIPSLRFLCVLCVSAVKNSVYFNRRVRRGCAESFPEYKYAVEASCDQLSYAQQRPQTEVYRTPP
jgi:hypothetical protein